MWIDFQRQRFGYESLRTIIKYNGNISVVQTVCYVFPEGYIVSHPLESVTAQYLYCDLPSPYDIAYTYGSKENPVGMSATF